MSIEFSCPECDRSLKVKDELAGRRVKCPGCQSALTVPAEEEDEAPPPKKKPAVKPAPSRRPKDDDEEDERPRKASKRRDEEDEEEEDERPRKRRRDKDEEEDDRPRKKKKAAAKSSLPLILAIVGGVVLLAGIGVGVWWMTSGPSKSGPVAGGGDKDKGGKPDGGKDGSKPETGPYSSPEATWMTVGKANNEGDFKAFISGFVVEDQKRYAAQRTLRLLFQRVETEDGPEAASYKEKNKPIIDALDKHGLTSEVCKKEFKRRSPADPDEPFLEKLLPLVKDPAGLYADIRAAMVAVYKRSNPEHTYYADKMTDVKIEGDKATGQVTLEGVPPVHHDFVKIGGEWRITEGPGGR
ncbi:MAG: hypothetical protein K2W96_02580 [Gemmataceae bacterium]|nr:hypothetical protein [Gemmataceae bacterium]